jgi:hypothetical protein
MTRAEAKKQIDSGWLNVNLAGMFLGVDLDRERLEHFVATGAVETRTDGNSVRFKLDDICATKGQTSQQLLNKHFPRNHQRKANVVQRIAVLGTCAQRDAFRRKYDRLHKTVSEWIALPEEDFSAGELRLIHQLLTRAREVNSFELILRAKQLERVTGLDDEALPKARRSLERRGILQTERSGTVAWRYRLCDPDTRQPLTVDAVDADGSDARFIEAAELW